MNVALPPIMISSGFLPTGSLVESLTHLSNEVASVEKLPFVQFRNISTMIRRIKLLSSLFEDIREINSPLPPSSILCLTELFSVIQRVKLLIQGCKDGSSLWGLTQTEFLSNQFHVLVKEMGGALDILPLSLLNLSTDTREQVQLLHRQAKRVDLLVDPRELQKREELLQIMTSNNQMNSRDKGSVDFVKVKEVLSCIGLRSQLDYEEEISKLEAEAEKQAGTGGLFVVSIINNLISLVTYSKSVIFIDRDKEEIKKPFKQRSANRNQDVSSSSRSVLSNIPDEFRCPISLDLMKDPVIVSSGHTYDRNSIAEWINSGHQTCPKSGQRLIHMALIPNYALKSLVHQWCQDNNVPLIDDSSFSKFERSSSMSKLSEKGIDHKSATKAAMDTVKMTAEFLVGKLAMGSP
ncbi:hypothetical protein OIU78_005386 [Salix suchowensis]|nr:hypothetical protein OIU78_005386 [Salix suchowensis]